MLYQGESILHWLTGTTEYEETWMNVSNKTVLLWWLNFRSLVPFEGHWNCNLVLMLKSSRFHLNWYLSSLFWKTDFSVCVCILTCLLFGLPSQKLNHCIPPSQCLVIFPLANINFHTLLFLKKNKSLTPGFIHFLCSWSTSMEWQLWSMIYGLTSTLLVVGWLFFIAKSG